MHIILLVIQIVKIKTTKDKMNCNQTTNNYNENNYPSPKNNNIKKYKTNKKGGFFQLVNLIRY